MFPHERGAYEFAITSCYWHFLQTWMQHLPQTVCWHAEHVIIVQLRHFAVPHVRRFLSIAHAASMFVSSETSSCCTFLVSSSQTRWMNWRRPMLDFWILTQQYDSTVDEHHIQDVVQDMHGPSSTACLHRRCSWHLIDDIDSTILCVEGFCLRWFRE